VEAESRYREAYDAVLDRWPAGREQLRLTTGYGTTVVHAAGPTSGAPVLLMHGGGATAASWFANVGPLAGRCRVYAADRPGEPGLSEPGPTEIREREDWMSWIGSLLDRLGVETCALVGHSYGAWLALSYALRSPGRVSQLALIDPTSCFGGSRPGYTVRAIPLFVRPTAQRMRRFLEWETGGRPLAPELLELLACGEADFPAGRLVFPTRPARDGLRTMDLPLLLALPRESRQNDPAAIARRARQLVKGVRVVELPDQTHHSVPSYRPELLNSTLVEFLGGHGAGS
jgi:pimeloyl-ACP methyl ester carboxylesterase